MAIDWLALIVGQRTILVILVKLLVDVAVGQILGVLLEAAHEARAISLEHRRSGLLGKLRTQRRIVIGAAGLNLNRNAGFLLECLAELNPCRLLFGFLVEIVDASVLAFRRGTVAACGKSAEAQSKSRNHADCTKHPLLVFHFQSFLVPCDLLRFAGTMYTISSSFPTVKQCILVLDVYEFI